MIKIDEFGRNRLLSPEEVSAELLKGMKSYAETYLGGESVTNAVITVPAYFDTRQRAATKEAAELAGLNVLRLLTEPTAAAIALAMKSRQANRTILVYDLGGGTFDVSVGKIIDGELKILGINGDTHLGGEDFDEMIVSDYIAKFEVEHRVRFPTDNVLRRRLRNLCREAKENMAGMKAEQKIDMTVSINNTNYTYEYSIDRDKFYAMCGPSFLGTMGVLDGALNTAKLQPNQINDILLVGGSTRIPWIKELIRQKFPKSEILQCVNPDEAVAIGAAILASQLDNNYVLPSSILQENDNIQNMNNRTNYAAAFMRLDIHEAMPLSIGMELRYGLVKIVIPRGTIYPCKQTLETGTVADNQSHFVAEIYEGERARTKDNIKIGAIKMHDLQQVPRGSRHITTFEIDGNGIIHVSHLEECSNRNENLQITFDGPKKTSTDIARYVTDAIVHEQEDNLFREICDLRRRIDTYLHSEKNRLTLNQNKLPQPRIGAALDLIDRTLLWLELVEEDRDEIHRRFNEFKSDLEAIERGR
ncbi:hypothetical protein WR25_10080 isoform C [Diploscapter pachys]|nr:hypothetical protein WR25_10080 isoform A [Diploscapter pachys]PAV84810.1 hypothetical protein WR25_10080 isoform C [Diploscapter pachys]